LGIIKVEGIPRAMNVDELVGESNWSVQRLLETREIVEALIT
jgi:hypothetical protein